MRRAERDCIESGRTELSWMQRHGAAQSNRGLSSLPRSLSPCTLSLPLSSAVISVICSVRGILHIPEGVCAHLIGHVYCHCAKKRAGGQRKSEHGGAYNIAFVVCSCSLESYSLNAG